MLSACAPSGIKISASKNHCLIQVYRLYIPQSVVQQKETSPEADLALNNSYACPCYHPGRTSYSSVIQGLLIFSFISTFSFISSYFFLFKFFFLVYFSVGYSHKDGRC